MAWVWERFGAEDVHLYVDRQGGRKRYGNFLNATFPFCRVRMLGESAAVSEYMIEDDGRHMRVTFETRADQHYMATALASMLSKYARELFMEMQNAFWVKRLPGLRRTAGYVQDGRRFLAEIEAARVAENIPSEILVRCR